MFYRSKSIQTDWFNRIMHLEVFFFYLFLFVPKLPFFVHRIRPARVGLYSNPKIIFQANPTRTRQKNLRRHKPEILSKKIYSSYDFTKNTNVNCLKNIFWKLRIKQFSVFAKVLKLICITI